MLHETNNKQNMRRLKEQRTEILRNERLWGRDIKGRRRFNSLLNMLRGGMPTRKREGGGEAGGGERGSKRQRVEEEDIKNDGVTRHIILCDT